MRPPGTSAELEARRKWDRRDLISAVAALALSPKRRRARLFFRLLDHNARAEDLVWFLNDLRRELGRKLHVVWDNLGAHRKAENFLAAIDCRWVRFHRLPPYAPELNPVEHVWSTGKWGPLANAPPDDVRQLHADLDAKLVRHRANNNSFAPTSAGQGSISVR